MKNFDLRRPDQNPPAALNTGEQVYVDATVVTQSRHVINRTLQELTTHNLGTPASVTQLFLALRRISEVTRQYAASGILPPNKTEPELP